MQASAEARTAQLVDAGRLSRSQRPSSSGPEADAEAVAGAALARVEADEALMLQEQVGALGRGLGGGCAGSGGAQAVGGAMGHARAYLHVCVRAMHPDAPAAPRCTRRSMMHTIVQIHTHTHTTHKHTPRAHDHSPPCPAQAVACFTSCSPDKPTRAPAPRWRRSSWRSWSARPGRAWGPTRQSWGWRRSRWVGRRLVVVPVGAGSIPGDEHAGCLPAATMLTPASGAGAPAACLRGSVGRQSACFLLVGSFGGRWASGGDAEGPGLNPLHSMDCRMLCSSWRPRTTASPPAAAAGVGRAHQVVPDACDHACARARTPPVGERGQG